MTIRLAANLSMLYTELPFLTRFRGASQAGFTAVEFLFPYEAGIDAIAHRITTFGLDAAIFNLHAGETEAGEWGTLSNPRRRDYFKWSFDIALRGAEQLHCGRLNMMFGQRVVDLEEEEQMMCAVKNLTWAAPQADAVAVDLLIEPLNPFDFPSYLLRTMGQALRVVRAVDHPRVAIQYDIYHGQMTEGNLINTIRGYKDVIRHIQIADVPGRHQPGTGEIRFSAVFAALESLGYSGFVGLEYHPRGSTDESLAWVKGMSPCLTT
jgi:hydroxypyruvate isomerase